MSEIGINGHNPLKGVNFSKCSANTEQVKPQENERPQMTEMPRISFGRDLVTQRPKINPYKNFLNNLTFPTDFDVESLRQWAKDSGLSFDVDSDGIVEMRDLSGSIVRRVTRDYNNPTKIYDDRIKTKDANGKDLFLLKYSDEDYVRCRYNYDEESRGISVKYCADGNWYDSHGQKLDGCPFPIEEYVPETEEISSETQVSQTQKRNPYKSFLKDLDFPSEFDEESLRQWAKDSNLNFAFGNGVVGMYDSRGNLIRRVTRDFDNPTKIYDDRISTVDANGQKVYLLKYNDEDAIRCRYGYSEDFEGYSATLKPDGNWYDFHGKKLDGCPFEA
ncbi:hypothetical protein IJI31_04820 [bacterium]|nr:hypothetical protein [bacterium]